MDNKKIIKIAAGTAVIVAGYEIGVAYANENYGTCLPRFFDEITPSNAWFPATVFGVGAAVMAVSLIK